MRTLFFIFGFFISVILLLAVIEHTFFQEYKILPFSMVLGGNYLESALFLSGMMTAIVLLQIPKVRRYVDGMFWG